MSLSSFVSCKARFEISPAEHFKVSAVLAISALSAFIRDITLSPVTASIRRTPAATLDSEIILKSPIFAVLSICVPPQNSIDLSFMFTTRTISPYFSPKSAIAPSLRASAMGISVFSTAIPSSMAVFTKLSTFSVSSAVKAEKCVKSKRTALSFTS